jgi:hypothetical protein
VELDAPWPGGRGEEPPQEAITVASTTRHALITALRIRPQARRLI